MDELMQRRIRDLAARSIPPAVCAQRAADWHERGRDENRGTNLVAWTDNVFADIDGGMVAAARFTPAAAAPRAPRDDERRGSRGHAGARRRTLPIAQRDLVWPGHRESARIVHSDISDNARADDDGMAAPA